MPNRRNNGRSGRGAPRRFRRTRVTRRGGRNDPPSYSEAGFRRLVISFNNTVSKDNDSASSTWQSITEASVHDGISATMRLTETDYFFRMVSAEIWAEAYTMSTTGTDLFNLTGVTTELRGEFNSLLGVPTSGTAAPKEEQRVKVMVDSGTRTRPMHIRYRWPRSHQTQVFTAQSGSTATNFLFFDVVDNSDTGPWTSADQGFYYKYMVRCTILWRSGQLETPTRIARSIQTPKRMLASKQQPGSDLQQSENMQKGEEGSERTDFHQLVSRWERLYGLGSSSNVDVCGHS